MTLVNLVLVLAIVGFLTWLVTQIPMEAWVKKILIGCVVFFTVLYILQGFGVINLGLRLR